LSQAALAFQQGRFPETAELCQRILEADPREPQAWYLLGMVANRAGRLDVGLDMVRKAIRLAPQFAVAHNDLGNMLMEHGSIPDAMECYRRAIEISPDFVEAHNNLGNACQMSESPDEAVACYRKAIELQPGYAEAHRNLGSAFLRTGRLVEAGAAFETALALNPAFTEVLPLVVREMQQACAWDGLERLSQRVIELVENGSGAINPFIFLCLETTPAQQFLCAKQWAAEHLPEPAARPKPRLAEGPLTIGYLSADFQEHATAHLISKLLSLHDRVRFQVFGYSYGRDDGSASRRRLVASFDRFVDLEAASFAEAASRIREDGVDIQVDLKGYTAGARPQILALRPAPIQVSYLGYPGTMGTDFIDFILADPFVVPPGQQPYFTERIVHLPDCYQVNDSSRPIAPRRPSRSDCGLPETGFVFCCFSATYKITPRLFDVWMRLLAAIEGSLIWLLESNALAPVNLRREAQNRGIAPDRLIFGPMLPNPEHLARFAVADLFLDTLPYNAHTLASDALWGGCPVLTCSGEAFPSRVAGSLLHAVGLPELVTNSLGDYEALALRLASDQDRLHGLRERLRQNRLTFPLFDSRRFARNLEDAYTAMWEQVKEPRPIRSGG
jgi:protein O-GlcNAc transferase